MASRDVLRHLGQRVHDLRVAASLTQESLAERAGITWHYVSAIERGTKSPTVETLTALAGALDVSLSELFLDVDRALPRELSRLSTALAGRSPRAQRAILDVVEAALAVADHASTSEVSVLAAAEPRSRPRRRSE